jgi:hypothetical protein
VHSTDATVVNNKYVVTSQSITRSIENVDLVQFSETADVFLSVSTYRSAVISMDLFDGDNYDLSSEVLFSLLPLFY